jgi:hypothetical protein
VLKTRLKAFCHRAEVLLVQDRILQKAGCLYETLTLVTLCVSCLIGYRMHYKHPKLTDALCYGLRALHSSFSMDRVKLV